MEQETLRNKDGQDTEDPGRTPDLLSAGHRCSCLKSFSHMFHNLSVRQLCPTVSRESNNTYRVELVEGYTNAYSTHTHMHTNVRVCTYVRTTLTGHIEI